MNRTLLHETFNADGVTRGTMLVAGTFDHPIRGPVSCAAAPAIAARLGGDTVTGPVRVGHRHGDGVLFATTYLTGDGRAEGFGVAADRGDPEAVATARHAMHAWSRTPRTRRVLVSGAEARCKGAARALRMIEPALDRGPVHVVGQAVEAPGLVEVDDLDAVPDGGTVVFPAHGVTLAVRAEAAARGLRVVDATCPLVNEAHGEIRRFADRGDTVAVVGHREHAATASFLGQAPDDTVLIENVDDARRLAPGDPDRLSYVVETGMAADEAAAIVSALRARHRRTRGPHPDGWCYAAADRADTLRAIAEQADLVLVCDSGDSAAARGPAALARERGAAARIVGGLGDLDPYELAGAATIGIDSTLAAPPGLADAVVGVLSGLGPLSVVRRRVVSEVAAVSRPDAAQPDAVRAR
ncbi:4-hydroxy-3-methylbut-2-enyl diphosphate reductase [Spirillospora sp. NPDC047279]|uniref:4-hydroxy-3-methylbut-2-enyl diphosphate reductase n=1 Tax=Spirillospora sp. NPDC047279 TaxID=3155478 RepID=UPI0033CA7A26